MQQKNKKGGLRRHGTHQNIVGSKEGHRVELLDLVLRPCQCFLFLQWNIQILAMSAAVSGLQVCLSCRTVEKKKVRIQSPPGLYQYHVTLALFQIIINRASPFKVALAFS